MNRSFNSAGTRNRDLAVHLGHDLNLGNLPRLAALPGIAECSIGHGLTAEALILGWQETIRRYRAILAG